MSNKLFILMLIFTAVGAIASLITYLIAGPTNFFTIWMPEKQGRIVMNIIMTIIIVLFLGLVVMDWLHKNNKKGR